MEIWDIYDKNRQKTGKTHIRGNELAKNDYHLVVMVLIFNSKNEMLLQKRQDNLSWSPGLYTTTCGGSAISGESSQQAAMRELFEELGISVDLLHKQYDFSWTFDNVFFDYYLLNIDNIDTSVLPLPTEEVQSVRWATKDEIILLINQQKCRKYRKSFLDLCFDLAGYDNLISYD